MKELLKNVVASSPLVIAVGIGYIVQPILFVAKKFSELGIFLHEKLETNLGKQITQKREALKKALSAMEEVKRRMEAGGEGDDTRLASVIRGQNQTTQTHGNVFVLGKKDENGGSEN